VAVLVRKGLSVPGNGLIALRKTCSGVIWEDEDRFYRVSNDGEIASVKGIRHPYSDFKYYGKGIYKPLEENEDESNSEKPLGKDLIKTSHSAL